MSLLAHLPAGASVAIVRLRSLGDCVLTTPAIHLLAESRPDLSIGIVVEDKFRAVFTGNPELAAIIPPKISEVRRFRPTLVVNLHGGTRSALLTGLSGARWRAGFAHLRDAGIHNLRIPSAQKILGTNRAVHTAEHLASVMFWLGVEQQSVGRARLFVCEPAMQDSIVVIHPFASASDKRWPETRFIELARILQSRYAMEPVFIGSTADDFSPFAGFRILSGAPLEQTKALISRASLFIGNDSGPAHIAAAFGIPAVVLFGPSDPVTWAPWQTRSEVHHKVPIEDIQLEAVEHSAARLLVNESRRTTVPREAAL